MIIFHPHLHCLRCIACGAEAEVKSRSAESIVIAKDAYTRRHHCGAKPKPKPKPVDRWKSLFEGITL